MRRDSNPLETVRLATPSDAPALAQLAEQLGYTVAVGHVRSLLSNAVNDSTSAAWCAVADQKVVGCLHARTTLSLLSPPRGEIAALVVDSHYQGRGLGQALVAAFEQWASERGLGIRCVRCNTKRDRAHEFYRRQGYREIKRQIVFRGIADA